MMLDGEDLGPIEAVRGRDDPPPRRWMQSALLGVLGAMFFGPALGFPIMAQGPNFLAFFLALAGLAVVLTLIAGWARPNRAVRVHARGWCLINGRSRSPVLYADIQRARFETGHLRVERRSGGPLAVRLSRPVAAQLLRDLAGRTRPAEP